MGTSPFFIVSAGRSGTTMLKAMLDRNPQLAIPWESNFIYSMLMQWKRLTRDGHLDVDYWMASWGKRLEPMGIPPDEVDRRLRELPATAAPRDVVETIYSVFLEVEGKERWGDKTPIHSLWIPELNKVFPDAQFIHLVRDGRDVAVSYVSHTFGWSTLTQAAFNWKKWSRSARRDGSRLGPDRYLEITYEDLVRDPEKTLVSVCDFLGTSFSPDMLSFHKEPERGIPKFEDDRFAGLAKPVTTGMRDWRSQMSERDQRIFEGIAGRALGEFGYERRFPRTAVITLFRLLWVYVSRYAGTLKGFKNRVALRLWRYRSRHGG